MVSRAIQQRLAEGRSFSRLLPKRPTGGVYPAQVFHLALGAEFGQVRRGTHGAAELFHQVAGAIDETLGFNTQALQQLGYPLGNQAALVGMQAAASSFNQIEIILEGKVNRGPQAAGAVANKVTVLLCVNSKLKSRRWRDGGQAKSSPLAGDGGDFLNGRPGLPRATRRPSILSTSAAKRPSPRTKLPLVAWRISSTSSGSSS